MKRVILILGLILLTFPFGFSEDLRNVYVKATRMFDEGKYFESYKLLDDVIKKEKEVPSQFFVKLMEAVKEGYVLGYILPNQVSNILEEYLSIGRDRRVENEKFWVNYLLIANALYYHSLEEEGCKELLFVNPSNEQGLFILSKILFYNKDYVLSSKILEKMLDMGFYYVSPLVLLSRIYTPDLSDVDKLINALTNYSATSDVLIYVATIYYLRMEFSKAIKVFDNDMIDLNPELYLKLMILNGFNKRKIRDFYILYKAKLDKDFVNFLDLYLKGNSKDLEEFLYDNLYKTSDESFEPLYINIGMRSKSKKLKDIAIKKMAYGLFFNKLYDKVISVLEKEKVLSDDMKYLLSLCYMENKDYKKAISLFDKINKDDLSVKLKLILAYISMNDYAHSSSEASKIFENVLNSDNDLYKYILSQIFIELGDIEKSERLIDKISFRDTPYYYLTLGSIFFYKKEYNKAEKILEEGYTNNRFNQDIMNSLSFVLALQGKDLLRALKLSKLSLLFDEDNYTYLDTLAYVYYKMGDNHSAKFWIEKSINLMEKDNKNIKEIYEHASQIYSSLGDVDKAKYMLTKSRQQE
ncbi:MAG: tetratricopeptide repeat protein [Brevinematia bacterium]